LLSCGVALGASAIYGAVELELRQEQPQIAAMDDKSEFLKQDIVSCFVAADERVEWLTVSRTKSGCLADGRPRVRDTGPRGIYNRT
jgi:hypothetical protein